MRNYSPAPEHGITDNLKGGEIMSRICAGEGMAQPSVHAEIRLADSSAAVGQYMLADEEAIDKLAEIPGMRKAWLRLWGPSTRIYFALPYIIVIPPSDGPHVIPVTAEATADLIERTAMELVANKKRPDPLPIARAVTCMSAAHLLQTIALASPAARPDVVLVSGRNEYPIRVLDCASFVSTPEESAALRKLVRERVWGALIDEGFALYLLLDAKRTRVRVPRELEARIRPRLAQVFLERTFVAGELVRDSVDDLWALGPTAELVSQSVLDLTQAAE